MRVAALYDVHGNLPALEAVLAEVEEAVVDAIVFGGDLVAGPFPRETLALARSTGAHFVRGNADREPGEWARDQLTEDELSWLAALPERTEVDGVLYCHATPRSDEEIVTPATPDDRLAEILDGVDAPVVVAGHTHMQDDRRVGSVRWVNAGSVGMPYEPEPGAYWALVTDADVQLRRTAYDRERAAERIHATGWPEAEAFARENVLSCPTREEAISVFQPS